MYVLAICKRGGNPLFSGIKKGVKRLKVVK